MYKKIIKKRLTESFLSEESVPGLTAVNTNKEKSGKINKDGIKDIEKNVGSFEKGVKKSPTSMPPNKFSYDDNFQKTYHDEMEIMNGQEMVQYDSKPDKRFTERALEAIEGSSNMGNNPEWANVVEKQKGFEGPDFGKNLVKKIKASTKKRSDETPTLNLRGRDIQADIEDSGHRPYAIEENIHNTAQMGGVTSSKGTAGYVNNTSKMDKDYSDSIRKPKVIPQEKSEVKEIAAPKKDLSEKTIQILTNWVQSVGTKEAAVKLINQLSQTGMVSDLPDTNEYGNGLNKVTSYLEKSDFKNAFYTAKSLASKLEKKAMRDMYENDEESKVTRTPYDRDNNNNSPIISQGGNYGGIKYRNEIMPVNNGIKPKNNNNKKQIKESMKRLKFKSPFNGLGNALNLIPESYRTDKKEFEMTDGNESYRIRWEGTLKEGKAVVLTASDKTLVNEDIKRMKELFGYKSEDTLGLVKGNARINENNMFTDIWGKSKKLLGESEEIESVKASEGDLDDAVSSAPEAKKHIEGTTSTEKGTKAPAAKVADADKAVSQAKEAKKHVDGTTSTEKGTKAPKPKEGNWDEISVPQAAEAKKHIHLKESETEEETIEEMEEMDPKKMMEALGMDIKEDEELDTDDSEEGEEEEDSWNKPEDDTDDEKEPSPVDIKQNVPSVDDTDDDEDELGLPKVAPKPMGDKNAAKLLQSPSTGAYAILFGGEQIIVPDEYLSIASDKSIKSTQRAITILNKMEQDEEMGGEEELDEYDETHQDPSGKIHNTLNIKK